MQFTFPNTQPHVPTRVRSNRSHPPPPPGGSAFFAEMAAPRAPPAAPKTRPQQDTLGPPAKGLSPQETFEGEPTGLPPPPPPRPQVGSRVTARQARFSTTWHHAVVSAVHVTNGRTHVSVIWDDDTTTHAIPLSRIRAAQEPTPPPAPPSPSPGSPFAHLCHGARVMARQTRHSPWHPATISQRHTYKGRLTITVDWEDTSEGPSTAGTPTSRVKLLQIDAPRPPAPPAHPTWIHPTWIHPPLSVTAGNWLSQHGGRSSTGGETVLPRQNRLFPVWCLPCAVKLPTRVAGKASTWARTVTPLSVTPLRPYGIGGSSESVSDSRLCRPRLHLRQGRQRRHPHPHPHQHTHSHHAPAVPRAAHPDALASRAGRR